LARYTSPAGGGDGFTDATSKDGSCANAAMATARRATGQRIMIRSYKIFSRMVSHRQFSGGIDEGNRFPINRHRFQRPVISASSTAAVEPSGAGRYALFQQPPESCGASR